MNELTIFQQFEADLAVFEAVDAEKKFDVTTPEGYAECKAYYAKLRKVYNGTDKLRKKTNDDKQQAIKACNADAKKILSRVDAMAMPRKAMLDAEDAKVQAEIDRKAEGERQRLAQEESDKLAEIKRREDEVKAKEAELEAKEEAIKVEEETKRREKQARKDAESQARREAEDQRIIEAGRLKAQKEQAEREKQVALDKAEADKQAAIKAEQDKAAKIEQDRIDKEAADRKEKERLAEIERKRIADEDHRTGVEQAAFVVMSKITEDTYHARLLIDAICENKIPNVTINY